MRSPAPGPAWMRARSELHRRIIGDVLEIGPGSTPTLPARGTWIGIEPSPRRLKRLPRVLESATAGRGGVRAEAVAGRAERLPVPDSSIDVVVSTWVLCSVDDQSIALREIRRVLRPAGRLVLCEHVGAEPGSLVNAVQRAVAPVSRVLDRGCDPSRQTRRTIESAGFRGSAIDDFRVSRWTTIVVGTADR